MNNKDNNYAIKIENVSKSFFIYEDAKFSLRSLFTSLFKQGKTKKFTALDNIDLTIKKGEFVGFVGKNGSGKSTLLKLISGIYAPDKGGKISFNGKMVPFLELGVGFNPELSGRENIFLNGTILGMSKKFLESKFQEIVKFAELENFIDTPVKNYSSGMMVRLAFSIAIQADADIFILDEILAVGDVAFQRKSVNTFMELKKKGKTILFVSHDMSSVKELCDRAILIHRSKVLVDDKPDVVAKKYDEIMLEQINSSITSREDQLKGLGKENRIRGVRVTNTKNEELNVFRRAEDIVVSVDIEVNKIDPEMYIGIGVLEYTKDSWICANNTAVDEFQHKWKIGNNNVQLLFPQNRFNDGRFYILVSLFHSAPGPDNLYDFYDSRSMNKYIETFSVDKRNGLAFMDHKWVHGEIIKTLTIDKI